MADEEADICVLEEPEHLNFFRAEGVPWLKKFRCVETYSPMGSVAESFALEGRGYPGSFQNPVCAHAVRTQTGWST